MLRTPLRVLSFVTAASLAVGALSSIAPSSARADHNLYVGGGIGPTVNFVNPGNVVGAAFIIREEFGWHPMGDAQGFFIALTLGQSLGEGGWGFVASPRIGYDIELVRSGGFAFQLGPFAQLPGIAVAGAWSNGNGVVAAFDMIFGMDVRFLLADRAVTLFVRPFGFDIAVGGSPANAFVSWEALVGAYWNFG